MSWFARFQWYRQWQGGAWHLVARAGHYLHLPEQEWQRFAPRTAFGETLLRHECY